MDPVTTVTTSSWASAGIGKALWDATSPLLKKQAEKGATHLQEKLLAYIQERLKDGTVPANRDISKAVEHALLQAARAFAYAVAAELGPKQSLLDAMNQRWQDGTFSRTPLSRMRDVNGMPWVTELLSEANSASTKKNGPFSSQLVLTEDEVVTLLAGANPSGSLNDRVDEIFRQWLVHRVQAEPAPACVDTFLKQGWLPSPEAKKNIRFHEAFVVFFLDRIKELPIVRDLLLIRTTSKTKADVKDVLDLLRKSDVTDANFKLWCSNEFSQLKQLVNDGFTQVQESLDTAVSIVQQNQSSERLNQYLKSLVAAFERYHELGLDDPGKEREDPLIKDIFVPPDCSNEYISPEQMEKAETSNEPHQLAQPLLPILGDKTQRRVVLLADPGMGKSTLIQTIVATLARGEAFPQAPDLRGSIPVPFILRDLVPHLPQDKVDTWKWSDLCDAFLRHYKRNDDTLLLAHPYQNTEHAFREEVLANSKAYFLIDGLDEIGHIEKRTAIRNAIWEGFDLHPNARWLVTSRIIGYELAAIDNVFQHLDYKYNGRQRSIRQAELLHMKHHPNKELLSSFAQIDPNSASINLISASEFRSIIKLGAWEHRNELGDRVYLAPFDDAHQDQFIHNWFAQRATTDRTTKLMQEIRSHGHSSIKIIARVPNMLCYMAILKRGGKPLPDGRAELYQKIVEAYLKGIDDAYELGAVHGDPCPIAPAGSIRLLSLLAIRMQLRRDSAATIKTSDDDGEITINEIDLLEILAPEVEQLRKDNKITSTKTTPDLVSEYLNHISRRSGLLLPRGEDSEGRTLFGFTHLSFLEYFAAIYLAHKLKENDNRTREQLRQRAKFDASKWEKDHPPGPVNVDQNQLVAWAGNANWTEVLVFLAEIRSSDTDDLKVLLEDMLPALHTSEMIDLNAPKPIMPIAAVALAMRLARDRSLEISQDTMEWRRRLTFAFFTRPHVPEMAEELRGWTILPLLWEGMPAPSFIDLQYLTRETPSAERFWITGPQPVQSEGLSDLLESLTNLRALGVSSFNLDNFFYTLNLRKLETLSLIHCWNRSDLKDLPRFPQLRNLRILITPTLRTLDGTPQLDHLEQLSLSFCEELESLKGAPQLPHLQQLFLSECYSMSDLSGVSSFPNLSHLYLNGCPKHLDLDCLANLEHLGHLHIERCPGITQRTLTKLRSDRPGIKIEYVIETPPK